MWTRHKEFAAPAQMKTWLVDGKPQLREYTVHTVDSDGLNSSYRPILKPGERFVECIGGHSYIVTEHEPDPDAHIPM